MPQYALAFMGAAEAGFVITTLNPTYTSGEIKGQLMNSETKFIVTSKQLLPKVKDATDGTNIQIILIGDHHDPNCISFETMLKDQGDLIDSYVTSPDSVVVLPYSSGTTGVPKGVQLTHRNLVAQMEQLAHPEVKLVDMEQVTVCVLPLYHIFAMHVAMSCMLSPTVTFTRLEVEQTGGSCGQLLPNTNMKVLDLVTEEEKGPGETGELCFQGPPVMPGNLKSKCNKRSAFFGANNTLVEQ